MSAHIQWAQENCPHSGSAATEYELLKYRCKGCGKNSTACLPPGVPDSAFDPRLMGLLATLTGIMHIAKREAIRLIKDLYDVDTGLGSVPNIEERVTTMLFVIKKVEFMPAIIYV